jgi:hypothetical protein
MRTSICLPSIITWGSITENFLDDCTCKGENNLLEFWLEIFLSYAPVVYLILAQARNHTITSNVNMRDMIWFLHRCAWSLSSLRRDLHLSTSTAPSPQRPSWSLRMSNVTYRLNISHHTLHSKTKLDISTMFACFTWLLGLPCKNHFLPTNMKSQCW